MTTITRRGLIAGLAAGLLAAPAIVRASSLMPVKPWKWVDSTDDMLVKCTEHYRNGPYGTIPVRLNPHLPQDTVIFIGAREPIHRGDVVYIENGLVRRWGPQDVPALLSRGGVLHGIVGVAQANTPWPGNPSIPAGWVVHIPRAT